jgi:hypothetical protein
LALDDYPPVTPDDDERRKNQFLSGDFAAPGSWSDPRLGPPVSRTQFDSGAYPPAQPMASPIGAGLHEPSYPPVPSATRAPGVTPMYRTTGDVPPTPQEYAPASMPGWKRALGALAVGAAGFQSPAAGKQAEEEVFERPREIAGQQFAGATEAYKTGLAQKKQEAEEARLTATEKAEEPLKAAQTAESAAKTAAMKDLVPTTFDANGNAIGWSRREVSGKTETPVITTEERTRSAQDIASGKNKTAEDIAAGRNQTAEDIAKARVASQELIAKGHDLVSTENARIRADAQNDPNKLTNTMKTMKQQAQSTLPGIDKALEETEQVANLLGPVAGRWNDFWQGRVGVSDPKFAHYKDEIGMVSSAVTLAHARGRMSNELFDHFNKMFDAGHQSAENMIQALNVAHEWLDGYAKMGETPAGGGAAAPPAGGPAKSFKDWKASQTKTLTVQPNR